MTPKGWKTSEFWIVNLNNIGIVLAGFAGALSPKWAALLITGSNVAYAISRGLSKFNQP